MRTAVDVGGRMSDTSRPALGHTDHMSDEARDAGADPRVGGGSGTWAARWSRLVGPVGPARSALILGVAGAAALHAAVEAWRRRGPAAAVITGLVAFDLYGGLVAFQLRETRAEYAAKELGDRLVFVVLHLQPYLLPLTGQGGPGQATARYAAAVLSTGALEWLLPTSRYRRLVANAVAALLTWLDSRAPAGEQRWLGPVYLMKLTGGHGGIPRLTH